MKKALIVGIDYYEHFDPLYGCVNDAHEMKSALERHSDDSINFGVKLHVANAANSSISRGELKDLIIE